MVHIKQAKALDTEMGHIFFEGEQTGELWIAIFCQEYEEGVRGRNEIGN